MLMRIFLLAVTVVLATLVAQAEETGDDNNWDRLSDHVLNGTVWTGDGKASSWKALVETTVSRRFVLIGENHDNADHHQIQANLIEALVEHGRKPAVVFEMLPTEVQVTLDAYLADEDSTAAGLGDAVGWVSRGWPAWETYQPIAEVAMERGLPMIAGGLGHGPVMKLARGGLQSLDVEEKSGLALDIDFPDPFRESLLEELRVSHCDLLPAEALRPMVAVQRARDGVMAQALRKTGPEGAVLIAGKGHTRNDRAIPYVLQKLDRSLGQVAIISIGLIGVQPDANRFSDYLEAEYGLPFDFVVFTDRAKPIDHCERLRERFSGRTGQQNESEDSSD